MKTCKGIVTHLQHGVWCKNRRDDMASRIAQLADTIQRNTSIFDEYLSTHGLQSPSFDPDGPLMEMELPSVIRIARLAVLDATQELRDLMMGPRETLMAMACSGKAEGDSIYSHRVAHLIPPHHGGTITYEELSTKTGLRVRPLKTVLRAAIAHRVFSEPRPGHLGHSAASRLLVTDPLMDDWFGSIVQDISPSVKFVARALTACPAADEPGLSAASYFLSMRNECQLASFYQALEREPDRARRFAAVMRFFQQGEGYSVRHILSAFDWASLAPGAQVIDIGGSHGDTAVAIARHTSGVQLVVQDLPETIASAPSLPHDIATRITFMSHDFFSRQPVEGASVYILRWVLHNWPDKYAVRILRALCPALAPQSRVLIFDAVVPPFSRSVNVIERDIRWQDLTMLALFNACDRHAEEWKLLVEAADPRYRFVGVKQIRGSVLSVVDVQWCPA
ncbi:hypothetical protein BST61_g4388 [Cercospora zeina]